jgi:UDP-N-acetylglucosamine acyltransferase
MAGVHPMAVVDPAAVLGSDVTIGPFAVVGPQVVLGDGVTIKSHAVVTGDTHLGPGCTVWPFAVVGEVPQDLKYAGEATSLRIGARTRIREHATVNIGTAGGGGVTRVGDDCLLMAGSHVAHDCQVGNRVILVNAAQLAGHVVVGDDAIIGGLSGAHQWVRIGQGAMIGGMTMAAHDVIPYGLVHGARGRLEGLNLVGLRRRGMPREDIAALRAAYDRLRDGEGPMKARVQALRDQTTSPAVAEMLDFLLSDSDRQFLPPT